MWLFWKNHIIFSKFFLKNHATKKKEKKVVPAGIRTHDTVLSAFMRKIIFLAIYNCTFSGFLIAMWPHLCSLFYWWEGLQTISIYQWPQQPPITKWPSPLVMDRTRTCSSSVFCKSLPRVQSLVLEEEVTQCSLFRRFDQFGFDKDSAKPSQKKKFTPKIDL